MQRRLYLEGEIGEKYGHSMVVHAESVRDALRLVEVNNPDFKEYMINCTERGVDFGIEIAGEEIEYEEEILLPLTKGDITITAIPAGGGGGFKKVLTGILIVMAVAFAPYLAAGGAQAGLAGAMGYIAGGGWIAGLAATGWMGLAVAAVGVSIAMSGMQEMMAPDPSTDNDQESSYLFNGAEQNLIEGDPVPVLYGRLQVPGQPINFEVTNAHNGNKYYTYSFNGLFGGLTQQDAIQ